MATLSELQLELANVKAAIEDILKAGQEYTITSGSGAGSSRVFKGAELDKLYEMQKDIENKIELLSGNVAVKIRPAW